MIIIVGREEKKERKIIDYIWWYFKFCWHLINQNYEFNFKLQNVKHLKLFN